MTRLADDLRDVVEGEVRFAAGDRALYAAAGSNYRQVPIGVVIPKTIEDVVATVAVCREHGAPVLSRGGGTSLAGQGVNVAVIMDFSKYLNGILEIDPERRLARVQPGVVLDSLRKQAESLYGLTFGPDPSTHDHCTFGGMIGNNSCGVHSVMAQFYGPGSTMAHNVHELDVLTYRGDRFTVGGTTDDELERIVASGTTQGEIYKRLLALRDRVGDEVRRRYPDIPRRVSGYNLNELLPEAGFNVARALVGTESTCVTVLEATVHLLESPKVRTLAVIGYEDAATAADHVPTVLEHQPLGLEGMDETLAGAWLGGTIDSTGAVAAAGAAVGDRAMEVAATVKMIQNILIGVVAFFVALYWVTYVERDPLAPRPGLGEIWRRFPKFILGFVAASLVFSAISTVVTSTALTSQVVVTAQTPYQVTVTAAVKLTDAGGKPLYSGSLSQTADYNAGPQVLANNAALDDATKRGAHLLADSIRLTVLGVLSK